LQTVARGIRNGRISGLPIHRPGSSGHLESTRILGSARRGNGKVHNTGIRRRRPRSAGRNDHNVFSNARRFSGRHCQIHADRSGPPPGLATIERFRHGQTAMPRRVLSGGRDYRSLEAIGGYPPCVPESPIRFVSIGPSATHESGYLYLHKPDTLILTDTLILLDRSKRSTYGFGGKFNSQGFKG